MTITAVAAVVHSRRMHPAHSATNTVTPARPQGLKQRNTTSRVGENTTLATLAPTTPTTRTATVAVTMTTTRSTHSTNTSNRSSTVHSSSLANTMTTLLSTKAKAKAEAELIHKATAGLTLVKSKSGQPHG